MEVDVKDVLEETVATPEAEVRAGTAEEAHEAKEPVLEAPKSYSKEEVDKLIADALEAKAAEHKEPDHKEEEYNKRLTALEQRELKADAVEILKENALSEKMLPYLLGKDAEETKSKVADFKVIFEDAVKAAVAEQLKGKTPQSGNVGVVTNGDKSAADVFAAALRR